MFKEEKKCQDKNRKVQMILEREGRKRGGIRRPPERLDSERTLGARSKSCLRADSLINRTSKDSTAPRTPLLLLSISLAQPLHVLE